MEPLDLPRLPESAPAPYGAGAFPSPDILARAETLEWIERRAFQSLFCHASRSTQATLGIRFFEKGNLFGGFCGRIDVLSLNRVLGLGQPPDSFEALESAMDMGFRSGSARVFLPVLPGPVGARAEARLSDQGMPRHNHWMRLSLRLEGSFHPGYPRVRESLPVAALGRDRADEFGTLAARTFGMPAEAAALLADSVGMPGWAHVGATWNGTLVGAGALYREGSVCWLGYGVVREDFRSRGVHAALIGERLKEAQRLGCAIASAETADWVEGRPAPSMRNLLRFGFEPLYRRPNYRLDL